MAQNTIDIWKPRSISNKFQAKTKSHEKPILVYRYSGWIDHKGSKIYEDNKSLAMRGGN